MDIQTILIVDDSKPLVELFKEHIIKQHKYVVRTSYNGKEALEILDEEHIDLIILDIQMPVMDGLQFLAELHNRRIWLPVIIMTGEKIELSEEKFREFGIVDYLNKPISFEELDKRIEDILKRRSNRDSISGISLLGILQVLEMERKTGILSLKIGENDGKIFFKSGKVVDIEVGNLTIEEALEECIKCDMEMRKIDIEYINHRRDNKINKSLTLLLLDAARVWDEKNTE
jgi:DNA-binding response OmpR family regulator